MKRYNYLSAILICSLFVLLTSGTASANSSWHWISSTRPYDLFPFVVVGTLFIETLAINFIPQIRQPKKVFCMVTIANLASYFAAPVIALLGPIEIYSFEEMMERTPFYIIDSVFLVITVMVELPIVFFTLLKDIKGSRWRFLGTIVGVNMLTTTLVAVIERTLCYGQW